MLADERENARCQGWQRGVGKRFGGYFLLMKLNAEQQRARVLEFCRAYGAAVATNNAYVINAVGVAIEQVDLPRLLPDRPTLEEVAGVGMGADRRGG